MPSGDRITGAIRILPFVQDGSAHWKHSALLFEKKELIPDLQQLRAPQQKENGVTLKMVKYS